MWLYYHYAYITVDHNLGYIPFFTGYTLDNPIGYASVAPFFEGSFIGFILANIYADTTKLYFMVNFVSGQNSGNVSFDFSYRIFKNELDII